ncbi:hypothetical protein MMC28_002871 [Mycoblastus sanguinarius]|nr:hypothetical protein [Mycoblastus sanguinarius]
MARQNLHVAAILLFLTIDPALALPQYDFPINVSALDSPFCDGIHFGYELNRPSCEEALLRLVYPEDDMPTAWGERGPGYPWAQKLPFRLLSSDGLCALELDIDEDEASFDVAKASEIRSAAMRILNLCVGNPGRGAPNQGGVLAGIGPLPFRPGADVNCKVKVSAYLPTAKDTSSYYDIWAAMVAVNAMCVRFGKGGVASHIGDKGFLTVELRRKVVGPGSNENTTAVELGNNSTFIESGINQTLLALGSNSTFSGSGSDAIILE